MGKAAAMSAAPGRRPPRRMIQGSTSYVRRYSNAIASARKIPCARVSAAKKPTAPAAHGRSVLASQNAESVPALPRREEFAPWLAARDHEVLPVPMYDPGPRSEIDRSDRHHPEDDTQPDDEHHAEAQAVSSRRELRLTCR